MALTLGELVGFLKIDRSQWERGIDRAHADLQRVGAGVEALGKPGGMLLLAAQAAQLVSALAPASGLLLALPAILGAAGFAAATVKVGMAGMGDAMTAAAEGDAKKLEEALAKLSPSARAFVKAWSGIREQFKPIQQAVQQRLFAGLDKDVKALGKDTLPALGDGLKETAGELNLLAREGVAAMSTPMFAGKLAETGKGTAGVLREFHGSVAAIPGALLSVINVGMPFIRSFAEMAAGAIKTKAEFLGTEAGAEAMRGKIQRGVDTVKQMIQIGQNLKATLSGIFGQVTVDGTGFLAMLVDLSAQLAAWVNSAQGQEKVAAAWDRLGQVAERAGVIFGHVVDAAGWLFDAINSLPAPVQDVLMQAIALSIVFGPMAGKLVAVGGAALGLLRGVGAVGTFVASVFRIVTASTAAQAATARASAGIVARMTAAAIAGTVAAAKTIGSWIAMGAAATAQAARVVAGWVVAAAGAVAQGAVMLGSMAVTAAGVVAGWVVMGVQSLIQAARMAAAWLIAMGPVGWVIAAVIGLVALIIANWDTVVRVTTDVWNAVWGWIKSVWSSIVDGVRAGVRWVLDAVAWLGELPGRVAAWFGSVLQAATGKLGDLVSWLGGLPGRILGALGDLGSLLVEAGRNVIEGLWRGIQNAAGWVKDKIMGLVRDIIPGPVRDVLGIASPSRVMAEIGRWVPAGLAKGIDANSGVVAGASKRLAGLVSGSLDGTGITTAAGARTMTAPDASAQGSIRPEERRARALVSIGTFVTQPWQSPGEIASELDWKSKSGG